MQFLISVPPIFAYITFMLCECQNCGFSDDSEKLPPAKDLLLRHTFGDTFSNVECPKCGALCVPIEGKDETE